MDWVGAGVGAAFPWVMLVAGLGAARGSRIAAFVLLAAVVVQISCHLVVGIAGYRRVMRRPWPQVAPLDDDDWW